jgi:flagellar protein FlbD
MILITRLDGKQLYINAELIQSVEPTPDTILTLTNNAKMIVKETPEVVVERIIQYQRQVRCGDVKVKTGDN